EVRLVRVTRMRADGDVMLLRERYGLAHRVLVTGVPAARDVRGTDETHELRVVTGTLTQVGVDVDRAHRRKGTRRRAASDSLARSELDERRRGGEPQAAKQAEASAKN